MLIKQGIDVSFAQGLDTKTDPKRVQIGKFLELQNTVFDKGGLLQKRNGYAPLTPLPDSSSSYLTTFNGNLTAVGKNIAAYNKGGSSWVTRGAIQPLSVQTLPVIRNNLNQSACDIAVAPNGVACSVYLEVNAGTTTAKFVIFDSVTGQNIVAPAVIPVASGTVTGGMRVFVLGNNFVMVFTNVITATSHLQYVAVNITDPTIVSANTDIASSYISSATLAWDGFVTGSNLYLAYNTTSGGQSIKVTYLTQGLTLATAKTFATFKANMMSVTADETNSSPVIYVSFYRTDTTTGYVLAVDQNLNTMMNPLAFVTGATVLNVTSVAQNGTCTIFYEVSNAYSFDSGIPTNYIARVEITPRFTTFHSIFSSGAATITASSATGLVNNMYIVDNTTSANIVDGTIFTVSGTTLTLSNNTAGNSASSPGDIMIAAAGTFRISVRSVGLASKAFIINGVIYLLAAYQSTYQPTYFLINGSTSQQASPVMAAKLAYGNGGGYLTKGLPGVTVTGGNIAQVGYLFKDLIQAVNKNTAVTAGTQVNGIYSQTGINLGTFAVGTDGLDTAEIGSDLHLSGGFLWMYDGYLPVEHNFVLFPDVDQGTPADTAAWSTTGGLMASHPQGGSTPDPNPGSYYYQFTYEWTDNQGNAFRSAPSIPTAVTTTGTGNTGSITLNIPTLRLTMKTANPVKIVIYRWSVGQQNYYQVTSITSPLLNDTTADQVTYLDTLADATILGNNLIYTTGGVVEDVNAPASNILALFDTRLWLVDAEDPNLLWFSKQVIEATPVEMSDLFTLFVPPTTATQGSTGPIKALSALDDKLITFKRNAILYVNGTGPDNTGANNQYSQPIFVTSTVGCANQKSIVLTPQGLMFQSDKGIWLLGRGLDTSYIGAPVQDLTLGANVLSAVNVPETNQVRFTLDTGITLMYDYYYGQWGTFVGVPAVSSCIYQEMHTFINSSGAAYQESAGQYLDGSNPVLMRFKTGPLRLGELQNYQRAYFFYLLGTFISPHKLWIGLSYDYENSPSQSMVISPNNYSTPFGSGASQSPFGQGTPFGGPSGLENWRVFLERQRCSAFNITLQEIFDSSLNTAAGAGLTISGLNIVCAFKKAFRPQSNAESIG